MIKHNDINIKGYKKPMENKNLETLTHESKKRELLKNILVSSKIGLSDLNLEHYEKILKSVLIDDLKVEAKLEAKKMTFDLKENIDLWLNQFESLKTKALYRVNLNRFLTWTDKKNLSILEVKSKEVFEYISFLNSQDKSNNYKNSIISAVSSFFSFLTTIDILDKNYFLKVKSKPKQQRYNKNTENIPTETELKKYFDFIDSLIESNKKQVSNRAKKVLISSKILLNNGLRIGALDNLELKKDGSFITYSKGKKTTGKLDSESLDLLKKYFDFTHGKFKDINLNLNNLKNFFIKYNFNFSSHSFRHLFSIRHYKKHKDIYQLSRLLNHANIGITGTYLSSLEIYNETEKPNFDVQSFYEIESSLKKIKIQETAQNNEIEKRSSV